jgi:hypothetical protein
MAHGSSGGATALGSHGRASLTAQLAPSCWPGQRAVALRRLLEGCLGQSTRQHAHSTSACGTCGPTSVGRCTAKPLRGRPGGAWDERTVWLLAGVRPNAPRPRRWSSSDVRPFSRRRDSASTRTTRLRPSRHPPRVDWKVATSIPRVGLSRAQWVGIRLPDQRQRRRVWWLSAGRGHRGPGTEVERLIKIGRKVQPEVDLNSAAPSSRPTQPAIHRDVREWCRARAFTYLGWFRTMLE